jgi:hypothetical protein
LFQTVGPAKRPVIVKTEFAQAEIIVPDLDDPALMHLIATLAATFTHPFYRAQRIAPVVALEALALKYFHLADTPEDRVIAWLQYNTDLGITIATQSQTEFIGALKFICGDAADRSRRLSKMAWTLTEWVEIFDPNAKDGEGWPDPEQYEEVPGSSDFAQWVIDNHGYSNIAEARSKRLAAIAENRPPDALQTEPPAAAPPGATQPENRPSDGSPQTPRARHRHCFEKNELSNPAPPPPAAESVREQLRRLYPKLYQPASDMGAAAIHQKARRMLEEQELGRISGQTVAERDKHERRAAATAANPTDYSESQKTIIPPPETVRDADKLAETAAKLKRQTERAAKLQAEIEKLQAALDDAKQKATDPILEMHSDEAAAAIWNNGDREWAIDIYFHLLGLYGASLHEKTEARRQQWEDQQREQYGADWRDKRAARRMRSTFLVPNPRSREIRSWRRRRNFTPWSSWRSTPPPRPNKPSPPSTARGAGRTAAAYP